jgi:hypothetical protein
MKKIFLLLVLCLIGVAIFVNYTFERVFDNDHDISIKIREKENLYELRASYQKGQTRMIQKYMDQQMHTRDFFGNSRMDADITLDDKTKLHVKTKPGYLFIRMRTDENDSAAYINIKALEKGIKERLGQGL